jgi:hypothetical protein
MKHNMSYIQILHSGWNMCNMDKTNLVSDGFTSFLANLTCLENCMFVAMNASLTLVLVNIKYY